MNSIRLFLTISIISIIILANFLASLHGYQESMQEAETLFDNKLLDFSDYLAISSPTVEKNGQKIEKKMTKGLWPKIDIPHHLNHDDIVFQVRDQKNRILFQSVYINELLKFELKAENSYINYKGFRWRSMTSFYPEQQRWVLVMEKQDVRYQLAESVILKSVYPIILVVPTIAIIIFFIVRRGLKPVEELANNVEKKQATELSEIAIEGVPEELGRLTKKINQLLRRLDDSLLREKRFSADAAHELRTPIAALNIQMKNLIDEGNSDQESVEELSVGVKRMSHLVEQILILNSTSPDLYAEQFQPVELSKLLRDLIAEHYPLIEQKGHEIELEENSNIIEPDTEHYKKNNSNFYIKGEFIALKTLFKNLILNAVKYTPDNGFIRIVVESEPHNIIVSVMDSGPGIPISERERIFERFYRLDGDRNSSNVIGCGLGLSIVQQIAKLHQASLSISKSHFSVSANNIITQGLNVSVVFSRIYNEKIKTK